MALRPLAPEASASANSATSAGVTPVRTRKRLSITYPCVQTLRRGSFPKRNSSRLSDGGNPPLRRILTISAFVLVLIAGLALYASAGQTRAEDGKKEGSLVLR